MMKSWRSTGIISFIVCIMLVLVACGGNNTESKPSTTTTPKEQSVNNSKEVEVVDPTKDFKTIDLVFSSTKPPNHVEVVNVIEPLLKDIETVTEGRITYKMFNGGALGKSNEQYDLIITGAADMIGALHSNTPGVFPLNSVVELPFLAGKSSVDGTRMFQEIINKFPEVSAEYDGLKIAWLSKTDPSQIFTTGKPIKTLADLKGMKLRVSNQQVANMVTALGATPVRLSVNELYEAMQKGVVDGAITPYSTIIDYRLGELTKYITEVNFVNAGLYVVINQKTWDKILPQDQENIDKLLQEIEYESAKIYDEASIEGKDESIKLGIEIIELEDTMIKELRSLVNPLYDEWAKDMESQGLPGRAVLDFALSLVEGN
jgi:TRAP-type C4-dicarboxylate transport system substrate-binding protein